jgi:ABC-2 type transport system permease protein
VVDSGSVSATYKGMKVNDSSIISQLEQGLNQTQFRLKSKELGLTEQQAAQLFEPIDLEKVALDENAKSEEELVQSTVIVYLLLFAIYFAVLMFVNIVAMEVVKEKSSRVMEILVSSVNPIAQMFGKILGVALLGIFQFSVYITIGFITLQFGNKAVEVGDMTVDFSNIPLATVIYALIFFLLAYLLYATIAAMLASLVSLIGSIFAMTILAAKVYRGGVILLIPK